MANDTKCVICNADFRPGALVPSVGGVKKCAPCEALYPKAFTKEEVQVKTKNKTQSFDEERARELMYEILEEAGLPRHKCEKCGKMFFRRKPMQITCEACGGLKKAEDKKGDK